MKTDSVLRGPFGDPSRLLVLALAALALSLSFVIQDSVLAQVADGTPNGFRVMRGTNISHWLSQSSRRGEARRTWFTEQDVRQLAGLGFDHLRFPIDEEQLWNEERQPDSEAWDLLHKGIQWSLQNKLRVVVDLHILRSHHFNAEVKPLWTDPAEQDWFLDMWRQLSAQLNAYPVDSVAYELMNEAVADDPEEWNDLLARGHAAVRELEGERTVIIGSNRWQSVDTFDQLRVPENDPNIILSFHFYIPMLVTHYRTSWNDVGAYGGPVTYPGQLVSEEDAAVLDAEVAAVVARNNGYFDRDVLEARIEKPLALARATGLPLYCGEWGVYRRAPEEARLNWYRDMRAILEANNIGWATWDHKGGFGIMDAERKPDQALVDILLGE